MLISAFLSLALQASSPEVSDRTREIMACRGDMDCVREVGEFYLAQGRAEARECLLDDTCFLDALRDPFLENPEIIRHFTEALATGSEEYAHYKRRLFELATNEDEIVRRRATSLLRFWPEFTDQDLPIALQAFRQQPEFGMGYVLARFDTPEARIALFDALDTPDAGVAAAMAIASIGSPVLPDLHEKFRDQIEEIGGAALDEWIGHLPVVSAYFFLQGEAELDAAAMMFDLACDQFASQVERMAALRMLLQIGGNLDQFTPRMEELIESNPEADNNQIAVYLASQYRSPAALDGLTAICVHQRDLFLASPHLAIEKSQYVQCLALLAAYGPMIGDDVEEFTGLINHPDAFIRAITIRLIGISAQSGFEREILRALTSSYWREVLFAVRSTGELGMREAGDELENVRDNHWHPQVREEAASTLRDLQTPPFRTPPPDTLAASPSLSVFETDLDLNALSATCPGGPWEWENLYVESIDTAPITNETVVVDLESGQRLTLNIAERHESVVWHPAPGEDGIILATGPSAIHRIDESRILTALGDFNSSSQFEIRMLSRQPDQAWSSESLAFVPGHPQQMGQLSPALFVVETYLGLIVLDRTGILGLAECAED